MVPKGIWSFAKKKVLTDLLFKEGWDMGSDTMMGYCTSAVNFGLYLQKHSIDGIVH